MHTNNPPSLADLNLELDIGSSIEELVAWLEQEKLTAEAKSYQYDTNSQDNNILPAHYTPIFGVPCERSKKKTRDEIMLIKKEKNQSSSAFIGDSVNEWQNISDSPGFRGKLLTY